MTAAPALAAHHLACRRGERLIFAGLDFVLPAGGALVLVGPNGSGKSSLLRIMAGLTSPEAGTLAWDGVAIPDDPAAHRLRLHFVGHADALKPHLTVEETVSFWAGMRGDRPDPAALERFRLTRLGGMPCRILSAGQRRRVALTRLVASPAPLWLLDEPLTGLDEESAADLREAIEAHRAAGGRVACATHAPLGLAEPQVLALDDYAAAAPVALDPL